MPEYRILVTGPSWIGDMVMAQSLFKLLHKKKQDLCLDVIAPEWVFPILKRMPEVNTPISLSSRHGKLDLWKRIKLGKHLKQRKYHEAIIIPRSFKSAIPSYFAGIKERSGFSHHLGLVNRVESYKKTRKALFVRRYLALASDRAYTMAFKEIPKPTLSVDDENIVQWLQKTGLKNKNYIVFAPGAEFGPSKQWRTEKFAQLADLISRKNLQICIIGSEKDKKVSRKIVTLSKEKNIIDLSGKTSLTDVIDIMSAAKAVVSNDSGLMHIAAASQTSVVTIYGSTSPEYTPPLSMEGKHSQVIKSELDCSPCFDRECRFGHYHCVDKIEARMVYDKLSSLIE